MKHNIAKLALFILVTLGGLALAQGVSPFPVLRDLTGISLFSAVDASAIPGNATINAPMGKVALAALAQSLTVTNSLVPSNSYIFLTFNTVDVSCTFVRAQPSSGSFVIQANTGCAATSKIAFLVLNP